LKKSKTIKENEKTPTAEKAVNVESASTASGEAQPAPQGEVALNGLKEMKLETFEQVIEQNQGAFLLIGKALKAIQEEKLYPKKFENFDNYCRQRWGMSDKYAYRHIDAYTCMDTLRKEISPIGGTRFPTNESQVRPLVPLEPKQRVKAWRQVLKNCDGKTITAEAVQTVVEKITGQTVTAKPKRVKTNSEKPEQKLVKIGKLVTEALKDDTDLTVAGLKKVLGQIQKLIGIKK